MLDSGSGVVSGIGAATPKPAWAVSLKLLIVLLGAVSVTVGAPFSIPALSTMQAGSPLAAGSVVSVELVAMTISGIAVVPWLVGKNLKAFLVAALLAATVGHVISIASSSLIAIALARGLTGIGNGVVICIVMTQAGRCTNALGVFAWLTAGMSALGVCLAIVLPHLIAHGGYPAIIMLYLLLTLIGLVAVLAGLGTKPIKAGLDDRAKTIGSPMAWLALLSVTFLIMGQSTINFMIVPIGAEIELSTVQIGWIVAGASALSVVCPAVLGTMRPEKISDNLLQAFLVALFLSTVAVGIVTSQPLFAAIGLICIVMPTLFMPVVLGRMAQADPSGRLAGAHPPFAMSGASIAPVIGGFAHQNSGSVGVSIVGGCLIALGGIALLSALGRLSRSAQISSIE